MCFSGRCTLTNLVDRFSINDKNYISVESSVKYSGLLVGNKFSWKSH